MARIALIGDLHGSWDDTDVRAFNASDYDMMLFTGDLGSGTARNSVEIARSISGLTKRAIVMPGNNDADFLPEIAAEFGHQRGIAELMQLGARQSLERAQIILCGYRLHVLDLGDEPFSLITARPCAMGGGEFSFPDAIGRNYGIDDMQASADALLRLVDQVSTPTLLILAHNGPRGLGDRAHDIWGCDFQDEEGDWGDPDLEVAVARAVERGLRTVVVAGHMHHRVRGGGRRVWQTIRDEVLYVNPARVPRIYAGSDAELRYHAVLALGGCEVKLEQVEWRS